MVLTEPGHLEPRTFELPEPVTEGALLEVEMTSVCGTDVGLYAGKSAMGTAPVVLGHEVVGRVVAGDAETLDRWGVAVGDRVVPEPYVPCRDCQNCLSGNYHMCDEDRAYGVTIPADKAPHLWGGYGEYMFLDPNSRVHDAGDVPPRAACLGTVVGNGVRWVLRKGQVTAGDSVAVVGPGAQGLASTVVASEVGARPISAFGLEADATKLSLAESIGATHTVFADRDDAVDRARDIVDGFDVVVVAAPSSPAIQLGIDVVRERGTVVLVGMSGEPVSVDLDRVVVDEISLLGGRGQALDVERAMGILERNAESIGRINSHVLSVADAETAIKRQLPGEAHNPDLVHAALVPDDPGAVDS
ncbi:alcohol dehydrogenase [Halococcus salifodinae DSM 8989]|uniref:Alcohol dehydrogenase n=2 Tax=Halococcus salifodinae TaxID=36738 RepID=M0NDJ2_9EURY|nr:alcohol dehydrogenase [Halococcus salifodinae DSM 8989]